MRKAGGNIAITEISRPPPELRLRRRSVRLCGLSDFRPHSSPGPSGHPPPGGGVWGKSGQWRVLFRLTPPRHLVLGAVGGERPHKKEISRATSADLCYNHPTNPKGGATGGWLKFCLYAMAGVLGFEKSPRAATGFRIEPLGFTPPLHHLFCNHYRALI